MCGIIGYTGKKNSIPIIMDGLSSLEYRGYDSAGITYIKNKEIHTIKSIGKIENLNHDCTENDYGYLDIMNIRSCYAESKRLGETLCKSYFV